MIQVRGEPFSVNFSEILINQISKLNVVIYNSVERKWFLFSTCINIWQYKDYDWELRFEIDCSILIIPTGWNTSTSTSTKLKD